jgi:membrane fusion protein, copper/silver efflux system
MNMKMKWILPGLMALALGVAALAVTGCNKSEHKHSDGQAHQYTCPMKEHSDVVEDKPGNCPRCGMKLVEKK